MGRSTYRLPAKLFLNADDEGLKHAGRTADAYSTAAGGRSGGGDKSGFREKGNEAVAQLNLPSGVAEIILCSLKVCHIRNYQQRAVQDHGRKRFVHLDTTC